MFIKTFPRTSATTDVDNHYLKFEVDTLFGGDDKFANFISGRLVDGLWYWDLEQPKHMWVNDRFWNVLGLNPKNKSHLFDEWLAVIERDDRERIVQVMNDGAAKPWHAINQVIRLRHFNGSQISVRCRAIYICKAGGVPIRMLGLQTDITEFVTAKKRAETSQAEIKKKNRELSDAKAHLEEIALEDALTGLPNRRFLEQELEALERDPARVGDGVALLNIDLDRFKQINDTVGHEIGDEVLKRAARMIAQYMRAGDVVARTGGDEFIAICYAARDVQEIVRVAEDIIASLSRPFALQGRKMRHGASIGVAFSSKTGFKARDLLANADIALYAAKDEGRGRVLIFTDHMQAEAVKHKEVADEILIGLETEEFVPLFQPQFCARTGALAGVEALARWRHPTRGLLSPNEFIDIAADLSVLGEVDRTIMRQAVKFARDMTKRGLSIPKVSFNVSMQRLMDDDFYQNVVELQSPDVEIALELLEAIAFDEDISDFIWHLDRLREAGCRIEIDDFGSGRASISCLTKVRPHRLKIDRSLITPIETSEEARRLVAAICDIGQALDVGVTAEGVENGAQAALLRDLGCDVLQGYAFSKPLAADELQAFLKSGGVAPLNMLAQTG